MGGDHSVIEFSSRPATRSTIVDYGKNLQNIEQIDALLDKQSR